MVVQCAYIKLCMHIPGQHSLLQGSILNASPSQCLPPFWGLGLSHVLSNLCTPPTPQDSEQSPEAYQSPQPPSMLVATVRIISGNCVSNTDTTSCATQHSTVESL